MLALLIEARRDRVEDRDPDTGYSHVEWLVPRPIRPTGDWLEAAFSLASPPSFSGRFRRRRGA